MAGFFLHAFDRNGPFPSSPPGCSAPPNLLRFLGGENFEELLRGVQTFCQRDLLSSQNIVRRPEAPP